MLYAILAGISMYLFRRNEINKIKLKQEILYKEKEQKRIDEAHALKIKHFNDISHEIRTPLTLMLNPIEELIENTALSPKDKRKILSMQHHGKSLLLLVNQLLEINRLELNKEKLNLSPTYISELISVIYHSFQSVADNAGINWSVDVSGTTEKPLIIDQGQLEKVLLNILSNAFKYTSNNGSVHLKVTTKPNANHLFTMQLEISDTGTGIAEQHIPRLFERFYKAHQQNNIVGSGIGLALVKAIVVDLMQGQIFVDSELGKGSTFRIVINNIAAGTNASAAPMNYTGNPQMAGHLATNAEHKLFETISQDETVREKSILIVEDNTALRELLINKLGQQFTVYGKTTAEEGLEFLRHTEADLVISDIMLPGMNGKDFCVELKSDIITSHIPFLLLTAIGGDDSRIEGLELGADEYLTKPFIFKELFLRVNNLLTQRERWRNYINNKKDAKKPEARLNKYDEELLANINNQIEKRIDDPDFSIEELGRNVGLSRVHLYRKLKALTGLSPSQFIRNFRLNKALEIIEKENIRIADLAYAVGFHDPNYFLKCFKEKFGKPPSQYAKSL